MDFQMLAKGIALAGCAIGASQVSDLVSVKVTP